MTHIIRRTAVLLFVLLAGAPLLSAQVTIYAPGCAGVNPAPTLQFTGSLTPGGGGAIHLYGAPPNAPCVLALGVKSENPDGSLFELPVDSIAGVQPGCAINTNPLLKIQFPTDANGEVHLYFPVPTYLGGELCFQFAVVDSTVPFSISISEALKMDLSSTVDPSSGTVDFPVQAIGSTSSAQVLTLINNAEIPYQINDALVFDMDASDFTAVFASGPPPIVIPPGGTEDVEVTFTPGAPGPRSSTLRIVHDALIALETDPEVLLSGIGIGEAGAELLVDCGASSIFMDSTFQMWAPDYQFIGGTATTKIDPVGGTPDEDLYKSYRTGSAFQYALDVPDGVYDVTLHFVEFAAVAPGNRLMDISAEGVLVLDDLDIFAQVGADVAYQESFSATVSDGVLDLDFQAVAGNSIVSAIEARVQFAELEITPTLAHDFTFVDQGSTSVLNLMAENTGTTQIDVSSVDFNVNSGAGHEFLLDMDGNVYMGDEESINLPATLSLAPGATAPLDITFQPTEHGSHDVDLVLNGNFPSQSINLQGTGGVGGHPFLHVVIDPIETAVDYDGDGFEDVEVDGSFSHTHEPGHELTAFTWEEGITPLATGDTATLNLAVGAHTICLTIEDDNVPPEALTGCAPVMVVTPMTVPGVDVRYYHTDPAAPSTVLDTLPSLANWVEVLDTLRVDPNPLIGGSPFSTNVAVQLSASIQIDVAGDYVFGVTGGSDSRIFVDGVLYAGPVALPVGPVPVEARFAVDTVGELPVELLMAPDGDPPAVIDTTVLTHDETGTLPFINTMPASGSTSGGNVISIMGAGFFPADSVVVHWGADDLTLSDFSSVGVDNITFSTPAHSAGFITVSVETPVGVSNSVLYEYTEAAPPPIVFDFQNLDTFWPYQPTCGNWGPDGRLYIGTRDGVIIAVTVDEDYNSISKVAYLGVSNLSNPEILGLAFSPFDGGSPVTVYVAHNELFAQGGITPTGPYPYNGQVSVLTGPSFDVAVPLITGLPVSNHDHGINGMVFDHNGDLLITCGGNTNAGIADLLMGDLPESPLSGAILKAELSNPLFNGTVTYVDSVSGLPDMDQRNGEMVDMVPGTHVTIHAPGFRNAFDMALATNGYLYATDNGANGGLGNGSSGPASDSGLASGADEILLVEEGVYYGHPNRNRGRFDAREYTYHDDTAPSIPGEFRQQMAGISSSSNGIAEYRATTFGGQMKGDLLIQRWKGYLRRVVLSGDGRAVTQISNLLPRTDSLGVLTGPGGAIIGLKYQGQQADVMLPQDVGAVGVTAYDIFPWRGLATGGEDFVIGGENFGTLAQTSVTIGGIPAPLTAVTSRRIYGTVPAAISPTTEMLDVVVTSGPEQSTITDAFRYLFVPAGNEPGRWIPGVDQMNWSLGEVAGGEVNGKLYLFGAGKDYTLIYDIAADSWSSLSNPKRPFIGDHHAAEVYDGKIYLFGGDGGGSEGQVQIYDPVLNSWSTGTPMPWNGASCSTALIDGLVYVAGGIVDNLFTTDEVAAYDPALDTWSAPLAPMVDGRNHAAAGTDGSKLYVLGGRGPGSGDTNVLANGFADIQIYDPLTDTWESSNDMGSTLAPMPVGRGGTGKAVYSDGEFYVFGGETLNGPGATPSGAYDRVDVYDPVSNTWRLEAPMPTARHGIFPILFESRIMVGAGATQAGNGQSSIFEVFTRQ